MINKLIEQQETIKGMQENENSAIKIMKMYDDYKLRVDRAIEYIENDKKDKCMEDFKTGIMTRELKILEILKGEDEKC